MNHVFVCFGKSCIKRGAREVADAVRSECELKGMPVEVHRHTCFDLCKQSCNVMLEVGAEQRIYTNIHPKTAHKSAAQMMGSLEETASEEVAA